MVKADEYERYMLTLINAERAKVGADALQLELNLNDSAEAHSKWMLQTDVFSHTGVGGSSATQRMRDADFDFSGGWRSAENIAVQSERGASGIMDDVYDLHISLMNSPGHRANILNPNLDYIGIGIELGGFNFGTGEYTSVIVTQNFATTGGQVDLDLDTPTAPAAPSAAEQPAGAAAAKAASDAPPQEKEVTYGTDTDDVLSGGAGYDWIAAGSGNDEVSGGSGNDELMGEAGHDLLMGGTGADEVDGGAGADRIYGNTGWDDLFGMSGEDYLSGFSGADYLSGGRGADTLEGGSGNDKVYGNTGNDHIAGGIGADYVSGGAGSDMIYGNTGLDTLIGGSGLDTLSGGAGSDRLDGGVGSDILKGGGNNDTFVFKRGYDTDRIVDFQNNADRIDLRSFDFSSTSQALSNARQSGSDVVFDFGGGDRLIVEDVTVAMLGDDLWI